MDIKTVIQLEFTPENIRKVIEWGTQGSDSPHSHKDIANWCEKFWTKYSDVDTSPEIEKYMPLLAEIECEWDMYEAQYRQYPKAIESLLVLPEQYFIKWLENLNA